MSLSVRWSVRELRHGSWSFIAGKISTSGVTFEERWINTDYNQEMNPDWEDPDTFYNDVPPDFAAEAKRLAEGREHFPNKP